MDRTDEAVVLVWLKRMPQSQFVSLSDRGCYLILGASVCDGVHPLWWGERAARDRPEVELLHQRREEEKQLLFRELFSQTASFACSVEKWVLCHTLFQIDELWSREIILSRSDRLQRLLRKYERTVSSEI